MEAPTDSCGSDAEFEMMSDKPATPQQTAVAAKTNPSGKATTIRQWAPPGMDVYRVSHAHSLRKGVADKPATGSEPPPGPITLPGRMPDGKWVNLNNWVITHVVASHEMDAKVFLEMDCQDNLAHNSCLSIATTKTSSASASS